MPDASAAEMDLWITGNWEGDEQWWIKTHNSMPTGEEIDQMWDDFYAQLKEMDAAEDNQNADV